MPARCPATIAVLAAAVGTAAADPGDYTASVERPAEPAPNERPAKPVARDVDNAPLPGDESGRVDLVDAPDGTGRKIARVALFVPKLLAEIGFAPIRGSFWLVDRYELDDLYYRTFFNRDRTIGLYPMLNLESGFGVSGITGGARFVDRDTFGENEHLSAQAAWGTAYNRQLYSAEIRSGDRFGKDFHLALDSGYEQRPRDPFYGIGNGSTSKTAPSTLVDPTTDPTAVATHFSQDRARVALIGDERLVSKLHVRGAAQWVDVSFGPGASGASTDTVYDPKALVGYMNGVSYAYGEGELRWDDRHAQERLEPNHFYDSGSLLAVFGGRVFGLDASADYWRYGLDAEHFFRLGTGPRVLALRLHGEGVTGSRDEVPFTELPKLGGATNLRGYDLDRFRDRVAAYATAEYQWDLSSMLSAALFVDSGRVYSSLQDLSPSQLRYGYGFALEFHTNQAFMAEASLATSIDGGMFISLALNPVFDIDERARRTR